MLTTVVFVPGAPIVVPEVAVGAAPECDALRAAGDAAVATLAACDRVVVLATGPSGLDPVPADATGDLRGVGVDVGVALDPSRPDGPRLLPPAAVVGVWWCDRAIPGVAREVVVVPEDADNETVSWVGRRLAERPGQVGLVVVGEGSAMRSEAAPGYVDAAAEPFDAAAVAALATADLRSLAVADLPAARRLMATGPGVWAATAVAASSSGGTWRGTVTFDEAPYGVGYVVATWRRGP